MTTSRRDLMTALGVGAAALATGGYPTRLLAHAVPCAVPEFALGSPSNANRALRIVNFETLEQEARTLLYPSRFAVMGPAGEGQTERENRRAFNDFPILPRRLHAGSSTIDMRTRLLGNDLPLPIVTAPMAGHGTFHVEAEVATARGTGMAGSLYVSSAAADTPMEDIAGATKGPKWFEMFMQPNAEINRRTVQRAKAAGFSAIVVVHAKTGDIESLREVSDLPVIVKGVVHPEDIRQLLAAGAGGIWVSNHGGRDSDGQPAAVVHLRQAADVVAGRVPIVFDSGVRRGIDVFKALALGATVVAVGRPVLWGLVNGGAPGVQSVYAHLTAELKSAMMLAGVSKVTEIRREHLALSKSV